MTPSDPSAARRTPPAGFRNRVLACLVVGVLLVGLTVSWALTRRTPMPVIDPTVRLDEPGMVLRDTTTGRLSVQRSSGRAQSALSCARVYVAAGTGVCLRRNPDRPGTYEVAILDTALRVLRRAPLAGIPTRARLSASGRMAAWTVFVSGDSYASSSFSTRSSVWDLRTGKRVATLEDFAVAGTRPPRDANFWGVSFAADDDTFYATMSTGTGARQRFHLVRGSVRARSVRVVADGVECPSVSPDGTRVVYKSRQPDLTWRLEVMDLRSSARTRLAEAGNVDDQAVWMDDGTVGYGKVDELNGRVSVWSVPADGTGTPTLVADGAESPSTSRS